ncbi:MAG: beta-N-acetylhexosaminidase [Pseudohongiellaceae bacterium]
MPSDADLRIGQTLWPALRASNGRAGIEALLPLIERFPPGGVIVFGEGQDNVAKLIAELRAAVPGDLLVSSDLERGCGQQVREFGNLPTAMAIAACQLPNAAYDAGLLTAIEARAAGIDVVFAPVADVNTAATNPIIATRSFGDDPHRVAALCSAFSAGLNDGGVLAVAKHWPGHGSTVQDSHEQLARVTSSAEQLQAVDLLPFRTLIAENIGGLMVGHLEVPALDPVPGRPATASPNLVFDLLRRQLGYEGLVVTDALDMGGFASEPAAGLDVLQSGLDVLLMPADPLATAVALKEAHARHHLADEVLDRAVSRIATARSRVRSHTLQAAKPHADLGQILAAASLTNRDNTVLPLPKGRAVDLMLFGVDDSGMVVPAFKESLVAGGVSLNGDGASVALVITSVRAWAGSARLPAKDRARLHWAIENGRIDQVVVLGSPYELLDLPQGCPALLAYEATPESAHAAAKVLLGRATAPGRLPVGNGR